MKLFKKILNILSYEDKKEFFLSFVLVFFVAIVEVLGIASILPFVALLSDPNLIETNFFFIKLFKIFNFFVKINSNQFLFILGLSTFIIFILSLFLKAITNYFLIKFALMREYTIAKSLIALYLNQPYIWYLNINSADLLKNILSNVSIVVNQTILPATILLSQSLIILSIIVLLFLIDPVLALIIVFVLGTAYLFTFYLLKKRIKASGAANFNANQDRFKILSECFGAFKEIKIKGLEKVYLNRFAGAAEIFSKNASLSQIISQLPKYLIESVTFGGFIILILFLIIRDSRLEKIIPIISIYAFAGYRLMPAIQQCYHAVTQIRFSKAALDLLHRELKNKKSNLDTKKNELTLNLNKNIKFDNIKFSYANTKYPALKNINLTIPAFSKIGLIGTTGSGKSTFLDIILGLLTPSNGRISVDGVDINSQNIFSWRKNIGYVPQQIYLSDTTIKENIAFGLEIEDINYDQVINSAKIASLHDFIIKELPDGYSTLIGERGIKLSGGQRQRIGIARAIYNKPKVLILDEATSALDNVTEQAVLNSIYNSEKKITIIQVAHRLSTIKECDIIYLFEQGELKFQGNYHELLEKKKYL
jgi:ABC-type multidrug transport system fused ATPase/permease subunit